MSIYGSESPKISKGNFDGSNADLSAYVKKTGARMTGRINMGNKQIVNLAYPTDLQDAANGQYVQDWVLRFNDEKFDKSGGTLTGDIVMSDNKITDLGKPTGNKDAATKEYVDDLVHHEHDTSLHVLGRFMVWMNEDGVHYVSIRAKKNIDLNEDKLIEIKDGNITQNARPDQIGITDSFTMIPNPKKNVGDHAVR